MFNDRYGLTDAVISGRKTVTRRVVDASGKYSEFRVWQPAIGMREGLYGCNDDGWECLFEPYRRNEIVAVAQSYLDIHEKLMFSYMGIHKELMVGDFGDCRFDNFKNAVVSGTAGWNNKMFVRADLMPYQIRILDVRAERLQDITKEDCLREGIELMSVYEKLWSKMPKPMYRNPVYVGLIESDPREAFASLIDKISGRGTWNKNPVVWRIEFKLVK